MNKLKQSDFCRTAKNIGCEVEAIMAVAKVESGGRGGFDENGRLLLRFEGHHFRKYTNGKFDKSHPDISYPYSQQKWKPHGYGAFNQAFALDPVAAMLACSYGMFQVLGSHFDDLGFDYVGEFVDYLKKGEAEQLEIFVRFCRVNHLLDDLRRKDFAGFAAGYNGKSYRDFNYDGQMRSNYLVLKKKKIDCEQFLNLSDKEIESAVGTIQPNSTARTEVAASPTPPQNPQIPVEPAAEPAQAVTAAETNVSVEDGNVKVQTNETNNFTPEKFDAFIPQIETGKSWMKWLIGMTGLGSITAWFGNLPLPLQITFGVAFVGVVIGAVIMLIKYHEKVFQYVGLMNEQKADPTKNNPEIKSL